MDLLFDVLYNILVKKTLSVPTRALQCAHNPKWQGMAEPSKKSIMYNRNQPRRTPQDFFSLARTSWFHRRYEREREHRTMPQVAVCCVCGRLYVFVISSWSTSNDFSCLTFFSAISVEHLSRTLHTGAGRNAPARAAVNNDTMHYRTHFIIEFIRNRFSKNKKYYCWSA